MNKFIILLLIVLITNSCATVPQSKSNTAQRVYFLQGGIMLQVFNHCTKNPGLIYPSTGGEIEIPSGPPTYVPMPAQFFTDSRRIAATYQVYRDDGVLVGSVSRSFYTRSNQGIRTVQWIIGGGRRSGGQNVFVDHVTGLNGQRIC